MRWHYTLIFILSWATTQAQPLNLEVYDGKVDVRKAYKDVIFSFKNPKNTAPYIKTYEQLAKLDTFLRAHSSFEQLQQAVSILETIDKDPSYGKGANYDTFHEILIEDVYKKELQNRSKNKPDTNKITHTTVSQGAKSPVVPVVPPPARPKTNEPEYELDPVLLLFVGMPAAFLIGMLLMWWLLRKKQKEIQSAYEAFETQKPDIEHYKLREQLLSEENETQRSYIDELTRRNLALETKITELKSLHSLVNTPEVAEKKPKKEEFYMSAPGRDQTFNNMNRSKSFQPTVSMYRFTIEDPQNAPDLAKIEFITDETSVYNAVNYPDTYIFPICKIENGFNARAKIVRTVKPGKAKLFDGYKWRILEPIVLRYE